LLGAGSSGIDRAHDLHAERVGKLRMNGEIATVATVYVVEVQDAAAHLDAHLIRARLGHLQLVDFESF
jgi:hypothetical protein